MSGSISGVDETAFVDTGCDGHLWKSGRALSGVKSVRGITATGITGASLEVEGVGDFKSLGNVHFSKDVRDNLISANQLLDVGCTLRADATVLEMISPTGFVFIRATRTKYGGLFAVKLKDIKAFQKTANGVGVDASGKPRLNANDIRRATLARAAHVNSGHIDDAAMKAGLGGVYRGLDITARDVDNALVIFGPCVVCAEGKMTAPDQPATTTEPVQRPGHTIGVDIIDLPSPSIGGNTKMLIARDYGSGLPIGVGIKRKTTALVCEGLADIVAYFNQYGNKVERMVFDSEAVFYAVGQFLRHRGIEPLYTPAGLHNRLVERLVQEVKQKVRTIEAGMLFVPPAQLKAETILAAIDTIAVSPNTTSGPHTCPFTMVSGLLPVLRPYPYGQVGLCYSKRLDQPDLRTEWCIYLGLESNSPGHHRVFMPQRGLIYSRRRFDPQTGYPGQWNYPPRVTTPGSSILKMSDQEIEETLSDVFGQQPARDINAPINEPMEPRLRLEGEAPPPHSATPMVQPQSALAPSEPIATEGAIAVDRVAPTAMPAVLPAVMPAAMPSATAQGASPLRRSTRVSKPEVLHNVSAFESVTTIWSRSTAEARKQSIVANRVSLKRSLKQPDVARRNHAMAAAEKEVRQLVTTTAILPVKRSSLSARD